MLLSDLLDILHDIKEEYGDMEVIIEDEYGNEFDLLEEDIIAEEEGQLCVIGIEFSGENERLN